MPSLCRGKIFLLTWLFCFFIFLSLNLNICLSVFIIHATFDVQCLRYEFTKKLFAFGFSATSIGQSYMQLDSQANWLDFSFLYPGMLPLNLLLRLLQNYVAALRSSLFLLFYATAISFMSLSTLEAHLVTQFGNS